MIENAKLISTGADSDAYHHQAAERGSPEFIMSSGSLRTFGECPSRWRAGYEAPDSEAKRWGSLLDCIWLTPQHFAAKYVLRPDKYRTTGMKCPDCGSVTDSKSCKACGTPRIKVDIEKDWNGNADECRAWSEEQEKAGRLVLQADLNQAAQIAVQRLNSDSTIAAYRADSQTQLWLTAEWHDAETGLIIPLRALIDLAPDKASEFGDTLADLKSTRNAACLPWARWVYRAGYHLQAALYLDIFNAATGEQRTTWCHIVQENYEPWQTAKRMLSQDFLTLGRQTYRSLLALYAKCLKRDEWPDYDSTDEAIQGWTLVAPAPFMAEEGQFGPRFEFEDDEDEAPDEPHYDGDIPH